MSELRDASLQDPRYLSIGERVHVWQVERFLCNSPHNGSPDSIASWPRSKRSGLELEVNHGQSPRTSNLYRRRA